MHHHAMSVLPTLLGRDRSPEMLLHFALCVLMWAVTMCPEGSTIRRALVEATQPLLFAPRPEAGGVADAER